MYKFIFHGLLSHIKLHHILSFLAVWDAKGVTNIDAKALVVGIAPNIFGQSLCVGKQSNQFRNSCNFTQKSTL